MSVQLSVRVMQTTALLNRRYDLAVAWDWEYDVDFMRLLRRVAQEHHVSLIEITAYNLDAVLDALRSDMMSVASLLDRASDAGETFLPLRRFITEHGDTKNIRLINPYAASERTMDKAVMHYELIKAGVSVPHTVVLPSYQQAERLDGALIADLSRLKVPFVLKPANGGGGEGVVKSVFSPYEAAARRQEIPWDNYLAQEKIRPKYLYGWRCWFRAYYLFGGVELAWWDDERHIYQPVSERDKTLIGVENFVAVMTTIARVSQMDFFSSELVLTTDERLVAVDYVNDPIDLRLKSTHFDGLPDALALSIAEKIIEFAKQNRPDAPLS